MYNHYKRIYHNIPVNKKMDKVNNLKFLLVELGDIRHNSRALQKWQSRRAEDPYQRTGENVVPCPPSFLQECIFYCHPDMLAMIDLENTHP